MSQLTEVEETLESKVRHRSCPTCAADRGQPCNFGLNRDGRRITTVPSSHTSRYLQAVEAALVPPFAGGWNG